MSNTDRVLWVLSALGIVVHMYMVFVEIPSDARQGFVQRIFYVHVPSAWVAFLAFGMTAWKGVRYLMTRDLAHDRSAAAAAELGLLYTTLVLITGPLWARPVWGIWWTWDLRLTTTFVLWLMFLAYMVLRRSVPDRHRRALLSSVVGIVGFIDVPVVYLANRVKASQHPAPVIGGAEGSGMDGIFLFTLLFGFSVFTVHFALLQRVRNRLADLEDRIEEFHSQPGGM